MTRLQAFLRRHSRIALDTSIFIYQLEANARYLEIADPVFAWIEQPVHRAVTSTITMTELLVRPYRDSDEERVNAFYGLLTTYPNLEWLAPDLEIADTAARFRARHAMRTPDALQAATAVRSRASGFVTNDPIFKRVDAFEVLLVEELLPTP
jgi:predicted nucleic acid-binding protein